MNRLPIGLRAAPYIFYLIAFVMGAYQFATNLSVVWAAEAQNFDPVGKDKLEWMRFLVSSQPFAAGVSEAAYMASNGVLAHLLIAIHGKMKGQPA